MRNWQHMVSSDLQLAHEPVWLQGVASPKRWVLMGAATLRARLMARLDEVCERRGIIHTPDECFAYVAEFPELQSRLF